MLTLGKGTFDCGLAEEHAMALLYCPTVIAFVLENEGVVMRAVSGIRRSRARYSIDTAVAA